MTATIVASKNLWLSGLLTLMGSFVLLNSGLCHQIFNADFCRLKNGQQLNFADAKNESIQRQRFYHDEYEKYFDVFVIHHSTTGKSCALTKDESINDILDKHNVSNDEEYLNHREYYDKMARLYGPYIELGMEKDRRFSCRYAGVEKGYGIYADLAIRKDSVVGVYTGVITNQTDNKDYAWVYASSPVVDGKALDISIDSRVFGNFLRFVNHDDNPNAESVAVPYKNRWHRVYVATSNIAVDEEVTVSYGSNYWSTRDYIKV